MSNCSNCKNGNVNSKAIPYIVHESAMARTERSAKRLWIVVLVLIVMLVGTNGAWIWYEAQFEDIVTTTTTNQEVVQDSESGNNKFVGGDDYGNAEN